MNRNTAAALRQASYNLRDEAGRAGRKAEALHEEALAYERRAEGYREAAAVIDQALVDEGVTL